MKPHAVDVQVADNRWVKTASLVLLHVEIVEITGVVPFSVFDGFGSAKDDAVIECNV